MVGISFPHELAVLKLFKTEVSLKRIRPELLQAFFQDFEASVLGMAHTSKHHKELERKRKMESFPSSGSCLHHQSVLY